MRIAGLWLLGALAGCAAPRGQGGGFAPRTRAVDAQGLSIHTRTVGGADGSPALILIHGGPGLSSDYLTALDRLATAKLRVVTYDQRGVGKSGRLPRRDGRPDPSDFTIAKSVADLEAVIASLGAPRVHLLGHSWGGMIAQAYAAAHADKIASLSLVSAIPPTAAGFQAGLSQMTVRIGELQKEGLIPEKTPAPRGEDCSASVGAVMPAYFANPKQPPTDELKATTCHNGIGEATRPHLASFDFRDALAKVRGPALVFEGKADPVGVGWADESAAALSNAQVDKVEPDACGHFPWAEYPQAFFAAVEKVLGADR